MNKNFFLVPWKTLNYIMTIYSFWNCCCMVYSGSSYAIPAYGFAKIIINYF